MVPEIYECFHCRTRKKPSRLQKKRFFFFKKKSLLLDNFTASIQ